MIHILSKLNMILYCSDDIHMYLYLYLIQLFTLVQFRAFGDLSNAELGQGCKYQVNPEKS